MQAIYTSPFCFCSLLKSNYMQTNTNQCLAHKQTDYSEDYCSHVFLLDDIRVKIKIIFLLNIYIITTQYYDDI